jgi:D-xylose reductase
VERTLRDLKLDYLDLFLIHFPIAQQFVPFEERYPPGWITNPADPRPRMIPAKVPIAETWTAMEDLVTSGLVRTIGVSNFGVSLLRDLLSYARIPPSVLQVELHPQLAQNNLVRFCHESGIAVTGFSPLGAPSYIPLGMAAEAESILDHMFVRALAMAHGKTPAQIVMRWAVQRGIAIVPKTTRPERLAENLNLFDRHRRFNDPGVFCEAAFGTFFPIYE